jgi:hypothetical protein
MELDGPRRTQEHLREALAGGHLRPEDFSLRDLAEQFCGPDWVRALDPRGGSQLREADAEGVDVTAFRNITGQLVYSKIMEGYKHEVFVASRLVDSIPTRFDGEKIPGVAALGDHAEAVHPGMPYPTYGFGEDYIETPATTKHGFIVPVTREAIFFDRTNLVLSRAAEVGEALGLGKEKRILDVLIGAVNTFKWKGTAYNTYQTAAPWINSLAGNELIDWTDVDAAEQLFANMLDPHTGEPILIQGATVLVTPAYRHAAHRIFEANEIRYTSGSTETLADNPLSGQYRVAVSRLMQQRIVASGQSEADAKKWWFVGDFKKAFAYMENWPITVTQAPPNSEAEFTHDIVVRYKASERGTPAVLNPRFVIKNTG